MEEQELEGFRFFLENKRKPTTKDKLSKGTVDQYVNQLRDTVLDVEDMDAVQTLLYTQHYPVYRAALRCFLQYKYGPDFLTRTRHLDFRNPPEYQSATALTSKIKLQSKVLPLEKVQKLIQEAPTFRDSLICAFLYESRGRRAEVLNIHVLDIDFTESRIEITGKGGIKRSIYFHQHTKEMLQHYISINRLSPKDRLFCFYGTDGKPLQKQGDKLWSIVKKLGRDILGQHLHPHMFRHTGISHMADLGADLLDMAAVAGHQDPTTTQIYTEISDTRRKKAFDTYTIDPINSK